MVRSLAALFIALPIALSGCLRGSPDAAKQAADDFLNALVHRDVKEAWSHLDPDTRQHAYADNQAAFARDVNGADWSRLSWQFGPVVDFDYAWEVYVIADEASVPAFLDAAGIGPRVPNEGFILQVQTPAGQPYLIIAQEE